MFSIPIDNLTFADVNNFCQALPREGTILDYKLDFPARLEKTVASFANTYGGHIIIGVDETSTGEPVLPIAGVPLQPGLRERVVAKCLDAIYPPVYPEVRIIEFQSAGATSPDRALVVVPVQESDASAHAVDGGRNVYFRVDNISEQFTRRATVEEIEWLSSKRRKPLELKAQLLMEAKRRASHYLEVYRSLRELSTGEPRCKQVLWTVPTFPRNELASPEQLWQKSFNWRVQVNFDFPIGTAVPIAGGVRHPQSPTMNYWYTEVNRFGLIYSEIGLQGPGSEAITSSYFASLLVGGLRFSLRLYESLGYFGLIDLGVDVTPTRNRYPFVPGAIGDEHLRDYRTLEDTISLGFTAPVQQIRESLMQRAMQCYQEFFWAFGFRMEEAMAASHFASFGIS